MKFCCASNAAIKNVKIARKKIKLFSQNIFNKIAILKKNTKFFRKQGIFSISGSSSRHFDYLFTRLGLIIIKAMNQLIPTSC